MKQLYSNLFAILAVLVLLTGTHASRADVTVFATPVTTSGSNGFCPGSYTGYVFYSKTVANGWGWAPSTNTTVFKATDGGGRTDTKVDFVGKSNDTGCNQTSVTIPNPPTSTKYRFYIYFTNSVPTTNYPIVLTGFDP